MPLGMKEKGNLEGQQCFISWKLLPPYHQDISISFTAQADGLGLICSGVIPARSGMLSTKPGVDLLVTLQTPFLLALLLSLPHPPQFSTLAL